MKTATFPSLRVEPEFRQAAEQVLREVPVLLRNPSAKTSPAGNYEANSSPADLPRANTRARPEDMSARTPYSVG